MSAPRGGIALCAAFAAMALGGLAACSSTGRARTETTLAKLLISDEQSVAIGEQVHAELAKHGVRYVRDPAIVRYVEGIASKIVPQAERERPGLEYHVHVVDDPKVVNAMATPGGHAYIYTGLLLEAENEAEVAGVLGHEMAHVAARHVERAMVNSFGLQALASLALGENPSLAKQLAASLAATGALRAHSRSEETEADEIGARYMSAAGYDPRAIVTFFRKLAARSGKTPKALAWLQSHPPAQDRLEHLERYIVENRLRGADLGVERHATVRQRLATQARRD